MDESSPSSVHTLFSPPPHSNPTIGNSGISSSSNVESLGKRIKRLFSRPHLVSWMSRTRDRMAIGTATADIKSSGGEKLATMDKGPHSDREPRRLVREMMTNGNMIGV